MGEASITASVLYGVKDLRLVGSFYFSVLRK